MKPLSPTGSKWIEEELPSHLPLSDGAQAWYCHENGVYVISSVDQTLAGGGCEYHLSIDKRGGDTCTTDEIMETLKAFGMNNAEEDNPGTLGLARHFWQQFTKEAA